jgi:hypothetical protein
MASLRPSGLRNPVRNGEVAMFDILLPLLGTGGFLLLIAYAELCERI